MFTEIEFLQRVYFSNTVEAYLLSLRLFLLALGGLFILRAFVLSRLHSLTKKTETTVDDFLIGLVRKMLVPLLYLGAAYFALKQLILADSIEKLVDIIAVMALVFQGTRLGLAIVLYLLEVFWIKKNAGGGTSTSKTILTVLKVVVWGIAVVFMLDNLGFNISAVVAGLGIGGIAIALAAQTILGDLFNYFVIFFDKPFEEGDFIITGEYLGVIEHVGIKTTRIRSLGGEQIVFANSDLTGSRVRNYKRMAKRRVLFKLRVTYQTTLDQMKKIPGIIRKIIEGVKDTVFDRAHFSHYGDFNLEIEVVYYVLSADYNKYMDIQEEINLKIKEAFEKENIEFAYPTQTLFVSKES